MTRYVNTKNFLRYSLKSCAVEGRSSQLQIRADSREAASRIIEFLFLEVRYNLFPSGETGWEMTENRCHDDV